MASLGRQLAGFGAAGVLSFGAVGTAVIGSALAFDRSFGQVRTITDLTDKSLETLTTDLFSLSRELGIASKDAVPALYQAISAGIPTDNVIDFLRVAGMAAVGGALDLETAVNGLTAAVVAFGDSGLTTTRAADLMFTTVALGKTTFDELARSLPNVLSVAANMGLEFSEVSAIMAVMTQQTGRTAESTTQLRQLLLEASKSGTTLSTTITRLSGQSFSDMVAAGIPVVDILQGVRDVTEASGARFEDLFGSTEALQAALLILAGDGDKVRVAMTAMEESAGSTQRAFDIMSNSASGEWDASMNRLSSSLTQIGTVILPFLAGSIEVNIERFARFRGEVEATLRVLSPSRTGGFDLRSFAGLGETNRVGALSRLGAGELDRLAGRFSPASRPLGPGLSFEAPTLGIAGGAHRIATINGAQLPSGNPRPPLGPGPGALTAMLGTGPSLGAAQVGGAHRIANININFNNSVVDSTQVQSFLRRQFLRMAQEGVLDDLLTD